MSASAVRSSSKRPRDTGAASSSASSGSASNSAKKQRPQQTQQQHNTQRNNQPHTPHAQLDADDEHSSKWSTLYEPLRSDLHAPDDSLAASLLAASASTGAAAAVGAAPNSFIPGLISLLVPSGQFENNFQTKLKDKNIMLDNSVTSKAGGINAGDATAKLEKKRRKKRGIQMMSANQRKAAGITQIPKQNIKSDTRTQHTRHRARQEDRNKRMNDHLTFARCSFLRYEHFLPLHHLWVAYMHDILDPQNSRSFNTSMGSRRAGM